MNNPLISPAALERYLSRRKDDLTLGRANLDARDGEALAIMGHKLKGNAPTFGFPELSELGIQLEKEANAGQWDLCAQTLNRLDAWITAQEHIIGKAPPLTS